MIAGSGVALASESVPVDEEATVTTDTDDSPGVSGESADDVQPDESAESDHSDYPQPGGDRVPGAKEWGLDVYSSESAELLKAGIYVRSQVNRNIELILQEANGDRTGRFQIGPKVFTYLITPVGTFNASVIARCSYHNEDSVHTEAISLGQITAASDDSEKTQTLNIPASIITDDPCAKVHGIVAGLLPDYSADVSLFVKESSGEYGYAVKTVSVLNNEFSFDGLSAGEYKVEVDDVRSSREDAVIEANKFRLPRVKSGSHADRFSNPYCPVSVTAQTSREHVSEVALKLDPSCSVILPEADVTVAGTPEPGSRLTAVVDGLNPDNYDSVEYYWYVQEYYGSEIPEIFYRVLTADLYSDPVNSSVVDLTDQYSGRLVRALVKLTKNGREGYMVSSPVSVSGTIRQARVVVPDTRYKPAVEPSSEYVDQGSPITFVAYGFTPGEAVTFTVHSDPVVAGTVNADESGRARIVWNVPAGFESGTHTVIAAGATSGTESQQTFTVRATESNSAIWEWLVNRHKEGAGDTVAPTQTGPANTPPSGDTQASDSARTSETHAVQSAPVAPTGRTQHASDTPASVSASVKTAHTKLASTGAPSITIGALSAIMLTGGIALTKRRTRR